MNLRSTEVALGDRVKDKISGFEGIVTSVTDYVAGCRRIGVSPETTDKGNHIDTEIFDEPMLAVTKKNIHKPTSAFKTDFKLGDKVKDSISGFEGICSSITKYLHADVWIGITPATLKDGRPISPISFPAGTVNKVKEQVVKEPKGKSTGGDQKIPRRVF